MSIYDPSGWELSKVIQQHKTEIVREFHKTIAENKLLQEKFNATTSFDEKLYKGQVEMLGLKMDPTLWAPEEKKVYSRQLQRHFDLNKRICPVSSSIIDAFPQIRQFFWNVLPGKGQIRPHYGVNGKAWGRIPDHARLQFCWEPGENCTFFLENECIEYVEDLCFGFHDGMDLHWVKNNGDKIRSVLILDLWENQCEPIPWGNMNTIKGTFTF
jgi:hypothetical protein